MSKNKANGMILDVERRQPKIKLVYMFIYAVLILVSITILLPIIWILLSSLKDTKEFLQVPPTLLPKNWDFGKFIDVWHKSAIDTAYLSTIILVSGEVICSSVLNGLVGYALSRLKPKGSKLVFICILWLMMIPHNLSMVPKFISFIGLGLADSYLPFWMMAGCNLFHVLLFKDFFDTIPKALIEAARIDGCSELGIFMKIVLPLSKPIVMTNAIFTFTGGWGEFLFPYLMIKDTAMQPIAIKLFTLKEVLPVDEYMVALILAIVPPLLVFCFLQKYVLDGMEAGGVKE